jgi:hypothetical protein
MDSATPKGKIAIDQEGHTVERICTALRCQAITLGMGARIDRVLTREGNAVAVVEIKGRQMSLEKLTEFGSYLLTAKKLKWLALSAQALFVPAFLFVHLIPDNLILYWQCADKMGAITVAHTIQHTTTQKTINGGQVERENAYLEIIEARVLSESRLVIGIGRSNNVTPIGHVRGSMDSDENRGDRKLSETAPRAS